MKTWNNEDKSIRIVNEDAIKFMDLLISKQIKADCIITDPPYNISKDNNFNTMGRAGIDFGEWDKNFNLLSWIDKADSLLNKNGSMVIFNDWKNIGEIAKYCELKGFEIKDMLRWEKTNPMPRNRDRRYITDFEVMVWVVKKDSKWVFNRQDENYQRCKFSGGLTSKSEKINGGHTTQKPVWLMEDLIKIHTNEGDMVFDPFMGSGTTGVACLNLNRNFIGCEIDENYFNMPVERLNK
jgi:site-specific DNA-methyltransferase (adenine-specific)